MRIDERVTELNGHGDYGTPKAHQVRSMVLPAFLADRVQVHLAENVGSHPRAHLFVGRTGEALRYGSWRRWKFDPAVRATGPGDVRLTICALHEAVGSPTRMESWRLRSVSGIPTRT